MTSADFPSDSLRPGEEDIQRAELVVMPNPSRVREYVIRFAYPEFTCKCPMTGYPDFATINIWMSPDESIVELKSLKLYLNRYRDTYGFHEDVTIRVLDDLVAAVEPRWARIVGDWNPRGNLTTSITAEHQPEQRPQAWLG